MSKTIPGTGATALNSYFTVVAHDRKLVELRGHVAAAEGMIKEITSRFGEKGITADHALLLHTEKERQQELLESLVAQVETFEAQLAENLEHLRDAVEAYGDACVAAGLPRPALRGNIFVRYLSAGSTGLLGSEKEAHACRFGDAWARASADTFFHAKRSFAYEEVTIKLDGAKIFK